MVATDVPLPTFEFLGNRLCLDFTNTVKDPAHSRELPSNYEELVIWSQQAGILTNEEAQRLLDTGRPFHAHAGGHVQGHLHGTRPRGRRHGRRARRRAVASEEEHS